MQEIDPTYAGIIYDYFIYLKMQNCLKNSYAEIHSCLYNLLLAQPLYNFGYVWT